MKVIEYGRVSTDKRTLEQQNRTVKEWLSRNGLKTDIVITEEGISGGVTYKKRKLGTDVLPLLEAGDMLIGAEISRLGRSMSDLNKLINDELKPRKIRLVVVQMGLDLNCANLKAMDEMILFAFSFARADSRTHKIRIGSSQAKNRAGRRLHFKSRELVYFLGRQFQRTK